MDAPLLLRWNQPRRPYHHTAPFVAMSAQDLPGAAMLALLESRPDRDFPPLVLQCLGVRRRDRSPPVAEWRSLPMEFDLGDLESVRALLALRGAEAWDMACAVLAGRETGAGATPEKASL